MTINKKGVYVCPECGFTATYQDLHPEEEEVKITNTVSVADYLKMRKKKDSVLAILADTELILFDAVILLGLRHLIKSLRDPVILATAKELSKKIEILREAAKKRPTMK